MIKSLRPVSGSAQPEKFDSAILQNFRLVLKDLVELTAISGGKVIYVVQAMQTDLTEMSEIG